MRDKLITLLRAQPFVPFIVTLGNGRSYAIGSVELMMVGPEHCSLVDSEGLSVFFPIDAIVDVR